VKYSINPEKLHGTFKILNTSDNIEDLSKVIVEKGS